MTALAFNRPDDGFDRVIVIKKHVARVSSRASGVEADTATEPRASADGDISGRRIDMHALRRAFPDRWGHFCRTHFRSSSELAVFFDTDEKTARNWMEGRHSPAGPFVARAIEAFPDAMGCLVVGMC